MGFPFISRRSLESRPKALGCIKIGRNEQGRGNTNLCAVSKLEILELECIMGVLIAHSLHIVCMLYVLFVLHVHTASSKAQTERLAL